MSLSSIAGRLPGENVFLFNIKNKKPSNWISKRPKYPQFTALVTQQFYDFLLNVGIWTDYTNFNII